MQASVIYISNVDPMTISRRLGHSHFSTIQNIYYHLLEQADDTAYDAPGAVLFGEKKTTAYAGEAESAVILDTNALIEEGKPLLASDIVM